jgi:diguanylate cyclase (GGDEF)-like protein
MRRAKIRDRRPAWLGEAVIDALFMAALVLPVYLLAEHYEGFETLYQATRAYEDWQLDEVVTTIVFLGWAGFIYAVRRLRQSHHEIALRRAAEDRAHYLARHDALTGLPNRRSFLEELTRLGAPSRAERSAVLIVDLDHFKPINDLHGHKVGDVVLRVVAARLRKIVGPKVLLARLGGDEFGIAMPFTSGEDGPSLVARRIVCDLAEPINVAMLSLQVGASVGIAILAPQTNDGTLIEHDRGPVETVLRQADMAMYRAKTGRRGAYRFFERGMDEELQQRIQLERQIRSAIRTGEIIPYYQPLVDLNTNELVGFEVLSRWQHPTRGLLQPAVLIPIAEDTGTISEVTYVLLRQAIAHAAAWPPHLVLGIPVYVWQQRRAGDGVAKT